MKNETRKPWREQLDLANTEERRIIDLRKTRPCDLEVIGHYRYDKAMPPVEDQASRRRMVIAVMLRGMQPYRIEGKVILLRGNQGVRLMPGEVYGTADAPEQRGELVWLALRVPEGRAASLPCFETKAAADWWHAALDCAGGRVFALTPEFIGNVRKVLALDMAAVGSDARVEREIALAGMLLELWRCFRRPAEADLSPAIRRALAWIEANHLEHDPLPAEVARAAGLSLGTLQRLFRKEIGTSLTEYVLRRKILAAQRMLREGRTVSWVAGELSFNTTQYFATVFRRYTTLSPREWCKQQGMA